MTHAAGYLPICPTCGFGRETANQRPAPAPTAAFALSPPAQPVAPPQNGLAIAALVCGIAGFVLGVTAPVAVILGIVALNQRVDSSGRSMAITGLVLGAIVTVGWLLVFMFVAAVFGSF